MYFLKYKMMKDHSSNTLCVDVILTNQYVINTNKFSVTLKISYKTVIRLTHDICCIGTFPLMSLTSFVSRCSTDNGQCTSDSGKLSPTTDIEVHSAYKKPKFTSKQGGLVGVDRGT